MSTKLDRIAELAREDPKRQFFSIAHLITPEALEAAFRSLRKAASAGVDGVTYEEYEANAGRNIRQLHQRLKDGTYKAQPLAGSIYRKRTGSRGRSRFRRSLHNALPPNYAWDSLGILFELRTQSRSFSSSPGLSVIQYGVPALIRRAVVIIPRSIQ
jgi:hypothetical protein